MLGCGGRVGCGVGTKKLLKGRPTGSEEGRGKFAPDFVNYLRDTYILEFQITQV